MAPTKSTRGSETMGKPIRKSTIRSAVYADEHYRFLKKNTRRPPARSSTRKTKARTKEQKQKTFPFLDLPAELRNDIYEYDMVNCKSVRLARRQTKSNSSTTKTFPISSSSGLVRVNRQVHEEYLGLAITDAPVTETEVVNFNFGPLITYFNSLEQALIKKMEASKSDDTDHEPSSKVFLIHLNFNKNLYDEHFKGLTRWLNRMTNKTKQGSTIEMQYQFNVKGCMYLWDSAGNAFGRLEHFAKSNATQSDANDIRIALLKAREKFRNGLKKGKGRG